MSVPIPAEKRVMLITRNLPPLVGGMERLNRHIVLALFKHASVTVIGPQGCREHLPSAVGTTEIAVKPLWRFLAKVWLLAGKTARAKKPAYVIAGSGVTAPMAWLAARLSGGKAVAYLHGLDIVVDNAVYQRLWLPFMRRCDAVITNSRNTASLAAAAGIDAQRITVINPGTVIPPWDEAASQRFREKLQLADRPLLLSVGRMTPRKGLVEFLRQSFPAIVAQHPQVCLLIIGDNAPNALTGSGAPESEKFDRLVAELGLENNVRKLGVCDDETLSGAYFASTVHVFPVIELPGDVEGFGMVALEAAAHGLPTVAFDAGGIADAVKVGKSGFLVTVGNYLQLSQRVNAIIASEAKGISLQECLAFAQSKSWSEFERQLCESLQL